MLSEATRFIYDAPKPADKLKLFRQWTNGEVSVLIGWPAAAQVLYRALALTAATACT